MRRISIFKFIVIPGVLMGATGVAFAQAADQTINVRVIPATTVEEKVANEMKEKELRKAAEEKRAAEEAAKIAETNPKALLSRARILVMWSSTEYFETVQLQNALRKRSEYDAWQLALIDDWQKREVADTEIDIDRPLFTFTFTYKIINLKTGILLSTGKVTALDGNAAAPLLAERIVEDIRNARGESKPKK
jgi:rRNA maturation endonuclease Nob1